MSYAADIQPIWDAHCVSCHIVDLAAGRSRDYLLSVVSFCWSGAQSLGYRRVEPFAPDRSGLWIKLTTDFSNGVPDPWCGREMPPTGIALGFSHPELVEKVRLWIDEGALDN